MTDRPRTLVSWSSGKDSAWALHELRARGEHDIVGLLTTIDTGDRVPMHAVRGELLRAQATACGLPLWEVPIPSPCTNEAYEAAMRALIARARDERISAIAFGDLFLEDIRAYRERQMRDTGINPIFPLFGRDTGALARTMIDGGLRAIVTCVDTKQLDRAFVGRAYDNKLLAELPESVDPCGERGEMHTFVHDGPMFARPVLVQRGEGATAGDFVHIDLREVPRPFPQSICHDCAAMRYVQTERSTFMLCPLLPQKYPPQPVRTCPQFRQRH